MKRTIFTLSLLLTLAGARAQSDVVPAGGTASGSTGSVSYTVGQAAVQYLSSNGSSANEGVQQPYEFFTVGTDNYANITLQAVVFPNPTHSCVELQITRFDFPAGGLKAMLYDDNGRRLQAIAVNSELTSIDLEPYATATYSLVVMNGRKILKTFKIVKTDL